MQINGFNGSLPLHMARAYGIQPPARPVQPQQAASINNTPAVNAQRVDSYQPTSAVNQLVAGKVSQSVNFDPAPSQAQRGIAVNQIFQMYTRAADKVEAAVAVQIGKTIDLRA